MLPAERAHAPAPLRSLLPWQGRRSVARTHPVTRRPRPAPQPSRHHCSRPHTAPHTSPSLPPMQTKPPATCSHCPTAPLCTPYARSKHAARRCSTTPPPRTPTRRQRPHDHRRKHCGPRGATTTGTPRPRPTRKRAHTNTAPKTATQKTPVPKVHSPRAKATTTVPKLSKVGRARVCAAGRPLLGRSTRPMRRLYNASSHEHQCHRHRQQQHSHSASPNTSAPKQHRRHSRTYPHSPAERSRHPAALLYISQADRAR